MLERSRYIHNHLATLSHPSQVVQLNLLSVNFRNENKSSLSSLRKSVVFVERQTFELEVIFSRAWPARYWQAASCCFMIWGQRFEFSEDFILIYKYWPLRPEGIPSRDGAGFEWRTIEFVCICHSSQFGLTNTPSFRLHQFGQT